METIENKSMLYRIQCIRCFSFLSNPFEYNYQPNKIDEHIKIDRYKGDNINYHSINEYNQKGNIFYSFIYCLKCSQKVGYWISQASKKEENYINKLFFSPKFINMIKYDKNNVKDEEDRKFKQEDFFYNSKDLTKEVIQYAKEHIDNFIKNVQKFENERNEAEFCYKSFDRRIIALKNLFIKNVKDRNNAHHLGIDFSKEEINTKKRNKTWNKNNNSSEDIQIEEYYDNKSNGKKNVNIIHYDNVEENLNGNNNILEIENDNENGGETIDSNKKFSGSDIYKDDDKNKKINNKEPLHNTKNNNKEPSNNSKINNKKPNKNKRKRK